MFRFFSSLAVILALGANAANAEDLAKKPPTKQPQLIDRVEEIFKARDLNGDGKLSREEILKDAPEELKKVIEKHLSEMDFNKDGFISLDEMKASLEKVKEKRDKRETGGKAGKVQKNNTVDKVEKAKKSQNAGKAEK